MARHSDPRKDKLLSIKPAQLEPPQSDLLVLRSYIGAVCVCETERAFATSTDGGVSCRCPNCGSYERYSPIVVRLLQQLAHRAVTRCVGTRRAPSAA